MPGAPGSGPVFLQDVSCSPTDDRILDCDRYVSMDESSEGRGGHRGQLSPFALLIILGNYNVTL